MTLPLLDDHERLLRRGPIAPLHRVAIVAETLAVYGRVRWLTARNDLPRVVAILRSGSGERYPPLVARRVGRRLGHPVRRTLDPLPWDSRCLMRSLVLLRMLARRGVVCTLVIGVRSDGEFSAHAWIEHEGRPLLPTLRYDPLTTI